MAKPKNKQSAQPQWRPNFRNPERLPDIKVVRTDFLLNSITVTIAAALLLFIGYREYIASTHGSRLEALTMQINQLDGLDKANARKSSAFVREARKTDEVADFVHVPVNPAAFLIALTEIQPQEGRLTSVRFSEVVTPAANKRGPGDMMHRIDLSGAMRSDGRRPATQLIDMFQERLRNLDILQPQLLRVQLQSAARDPATDQFTYTIYIDLTPPLAAK